MRPGHIASACCVGFLPSWVLFVGLLMLGTWDLDVLILYEQLAGHRLLSEKVTLPHFRTHRPISISSVPVSEGIEIRQGCRFIGSLVRTLVLALHGW